MIYGLIEFCNFFNIVFIGASLGIFFVSYFLYTPFNEASYESDTDENQFYEYKYLDDYYYLLDIKIKNVEKKTNDDCDKDCDEDCDDKVIHEHDANEYNEQDSSGSEDEGSEDEGSEVVFNDDNEYISNLNKKFIEEETPRGKVYMCYDKDTNSYFYYSKTKDIPYKYLETVARKYVLDNKCLSIFIDYKEEYIQGLNKYNDNIKQKREMQEKIKEKNENGNNSKGENEEKPKKNIYATFKSYNTQQLNSNINTGSNSGSNTKNISVDTTSKEYILTENCNHYKYKGNLLDYENMLNEKEAEDNSLNEYEQIDFKSFKELMKKND